MENVMGEDMENNFFSLHEGIGGEQLPTESF